ncbi:MAG: hypothetical protein GJU76_14510 [Gallionella sp.]|jgi:hypothetical protein|nr:hypothetical protein [Gallionella sp.]
MNTGNVNTEVSPSREQEATLDSIQALKIEDLDLVELEDRLELTSRCNIDCGKS